MSSLGVAFNGLGLLEFALVVRGLGLVSDTYRKGCYDRGRGDGAFALGYLVGARPFGGYGYDGTLFLASLVYRGFY